MDTSDEDEPLASFAVKAVDRVPWFLLCLLGDSSGQVARLIAAIKKYCTELQDFFCIISHLSMTLWALEALLYYGILQAFAKPVRGITS